MRHYYGQREKKHFWSVNSTLPSPDFFHFITPKTSNRNKSFSCIFTDNSPYFHPFTSTGKERDEETGYSYFGARYYDPEISGLFLSVDPMANKYPGISPYVYCAWNPIVLTDPNGDTIKNGYENYKDVAEDIQYYQNMASLTNDPEEIIEYNQQIDFLKKKHKNYQTVNDLILSFEKNNSDEFNILNSLSLNGKPVNIFVCLSDLPSDPETGATGFTTIPYIFEDEIITGIDRNGIKITIYKNGFADGYWRRNSC